MTRRHPVVWCAVLAAMAFMLGACATAPTGQVEVRTFERRDLLVEHMERLSREGQTAALVNHVTFGANRGLLPPEEVHRWFRRVEETLHQELADALEERSWAVALRVLGSLETLTGDPLVPREPREETAHPPVPSGDEIQLQWALEELDRREEVSALYRLLRLTSLENLSSEYREAFRDVALRLGNREALRRLGFPDDAAEFQQSPADLLEGTVTVWVNRGMRISRGVGVPDRVVGSGFFVDPRGYILTNYHVIASEVDPTYNGFSRLYVKLPGRTTERVPARVVGYDRIFDLALVKAELDAPRVLALSDTRRLVPGEPVLALGSPGGLDSTITAGIVSASGRRFLQMGEAVQIDAPVNPGNSGGPLVLPDDRQVAAVVFAGIPQFEGVNFVIPSYWIRHFFPRMFIGGEVVHPWIGASMHESSRGLAVTWVSPGSPAHHAGVRQGDRLVSLGDTEAATMIAAQDFIMARQPGEIISTEWTDATGTTVRRLIALGERPFSPVEDALQSQTIQSLFPVLFGMEVDALTGSLFGPDYVITRVLPGSIADDSSLSENDPFSLRGWRVDDDLRAAFIQIIIRKRKAGFLEAGLQLGAFLETNTFL